MNSKWLPVLLLIALGMQCAKKDMLGTPENPVPPNTLVFEFATKIRYVIDLKIDGKPVPIRYHRGGDRLWVHGLEPGSHHFNLHSVSYVFGPEFDQFKVNDETGAYFFIQNRKYRSATPKEEGRVSIRAYRREMKDKKKRGEVAETPEIWAEFE